MSAAIRWRFATKSFGQLLREIRDVEAEQLAAQVVRVLRLRSAADALRAAVADREVEVAIAAEPQRVGRVEADLRMGRVAGMIERDDHLLARRIERQAAVGRREPRDPDLELVAGVGAACSSS